MTKTRDLADLGGGFIQTGSGAVQRSVESKLQDTVSVKDFGAVGDGVADDTAAVQAAVDHSRQSEKRLLFPKGTYCVSSITIGSDLSLQGEGAESAILKQVTLPGKSILYYNGASPVSNVFIDSLGFDVNGKDSGIVIKNCQSVSIANCNFANNPFWGILIGAFDDLSTTTSCEDILIHNCRFFNSTSTYEHVAFYNTKNAVVRDCQFVGALTGGIGIGLYQILENITVSGCFFRDITKGIYYSVTTNKISISDCHFEECTVGIQGANESDQGLFGEQWVYGLSIDCCKFYANDWALEVGAVRGGAITSCHFERNINNSLVFSFGNRLATPTIAATVNVLVEGCAFLNNNQSASSHILHPGILFNEGGGTLYVTIVGCTFEDSQGTPTQRYPIAFNGAFAWSGIRIFGCRLASYSGGTSLAVNGGATLSDVRLYGCTDVSASLPSGSAHQEYFDTSGRLILGNTTLYDVPTGDGVVRAPGLQRVGTSYANASLSAVLFNTAADGGGTLNLGRSNTNTLGSQAIASAGNVAGAVWFSASNGSTQVPAAGIVSSIDGTPSQSPSYMPGRLGFFTTSSTGAFPVERLRLKSGGQLRYVPQSTPASAESGDVYYDSGTNKLRCYNGSTWNDLF